MSPEEFETFRKNSEFNARMTFMKIYLNLLEKIKKQELNELPPI